MPPASSTLVLSFETGAALGAAAAALSASQLDPMSLEVEARAGRPASHQLLVRFGGTAAANSNKRRRRSRAGRGVLADCSNDVLEGERRRLRSGATGRRLVRRASGTDVRASWLPAALPRVLDLLAQVASETIGRDRVARRRAAVGAGVMHIDGRCGRAHGRGRATSPTARIRRTRRRGARAGRDVQGSRGCRGDRPLPSAVIASAIKRALDPAGVLNAGRGPSSVSTSSAVSSTPAFSGPRHAVTRADRRVRALRVLSAHVPDLPALGRGDGLAARTDLPDEGRARGARVVVAVARRPLRRVSRLRGLCHRVSVRRAVRPAHRTRARAGGAALSAADRRAALPRGALQRSPIRQRDARACGAARDRRTAGSLAVAVGGCAGCCRDPSARCSSSRRPCPGPESRVECRNGRRPLDGHA